MQSNKTIGVVYSQRGILRLEKSLVAGAVINSGAQSVNCSLDQMSFIITNDSIRIMFDGVEMPSVDVWYIRDRTANSIAAALLTLYCTQRSIPQLNKYAMSPIGVKILQYAGLSGSKILFPKTLFTTQYTPEFEDIINKEIGFPCILKANSSYAGKDNYKVESLDELRELVTSNNISDFVVQQYIFAPGDYRILILGGKPRVCEYRSRKDPHTEHRNYGTDGFLEVVIPLEEAPTGLLDQAVESAQILGFDVSGLDFIIAEDKQNYFLECNVMPGIGGSKKNVEAFTTYLKELIAD
jgi:glutathione synthase/RimK-type ligase-like ATP-grasp enzyme